MEERVLLLFLTKEHRHEDDCKTKWQQEAQNKTRYILMADKTHHVHQTRQDTLNKIQWAIAIIVSHTAC